MDLEAWCHRHDGDFRTSGGDRMCEFSDRRVGIRPDPVESVVVVQDGPDPQRDEYRGFVSNVDFGDGEISGVFEDYRGHQTELELEF